MKSTFQIIFALIALVFAILFLHQCQQSKTSDLLREKAKAETEKVILDNKAIISHANDALKAIKEKMTNDSLKYLERSKAFKIENSRLTGQIHDLKLQRIESGVKVDTFTIAIEAKNDSLQNVKDAEIAALENDKTEIKANLTAEVQEWSKKYLAQVVISDEWQTAAQSYEQENKKLKRKLIATKVVGALLVVAVVVISL